MSRSTGWFVGALAAAALLAGLHPSHSWAQSPAAPIKLAALDAPPTASVGALLAATAKAEPRGSIPLDTPRNQRAQQKIEAALDKEIDAEFSETPLGDAAKFMQELLGVNVQLDQRALDAAGVGADAPVNCKLRKVSARSVLSSTLRNLELTWTVEDESLLITTKEAVLSRPQVRVYPVRDFLTAGDVTVEHAGEELIAAICAAVQPGTWENVGGPGSIHGVENSAALVISQTADAHRQVAMLLASLREAREQQGIKPGDEAPTARAFNPPDLAPSPSGDK